MKNSIQKMMLLVSLALSLQGCIAVAGAAVGAAAVALVYDHRTVSNAVKDTEIANQVARQIRFVPALRDECHIEVTVFNRVVLLTGQVPQPSYSQQAENIARNTQNVVRVYNQLTLEGPTSSLTRASDSWITAKIKAEMLATDDLKSSSIKVVTESGVVYLMGIVNRQQAETAVEIARQVSGVEKVVKIFQYTN